MAFSDDYQNTSRINTTASLKYLAPNGSWQVACPSRTQGGTYMVEAFNNINAWVPHTGGTASIGVVASGHADPAIGNAVQLSTGSTNNSDCRLDRTLANIPSSFGLMIQMAHIGPVSSTYQDMARVFAQINGSNKYLEILIDKTKLLIAYNGGYDAFYDVSGFTDYWEQWWEVIDNQDGTHTIQLWAGTELKQSKALTLPTGNSANGGLLELQQNSGNLNNRVLRVANFNIGISQLPDDMLLQSVAYTAPYNGTSVTALMEVENTSNDVIIGTDFTAEISIDNGANWNSLTLTDMGELCKGNIDYTKSVRLVKGTHTATIPAGTKIILRQRSWNGKFLVLHGYSINVTSIY